MIKASKEWQECVCAKSCRFLSSNYSRRKIPLPAPYFLRHKQDCFFQTFSLAASSAPERLCDLHYSEVSNPLTTSGNDKTPYHHLEVSKKTKWVASKQPSQLASCLMNMDERMNITDKKNKTNKTTEVWNVYTKCSSLNLLRSVLWMEMPHPLVTCFPCNSKGTWNGTFTAVSRSGRGANRLSNLCGHSLKSWYGQHKCSSAIP